MRKYTITSAPVVRAMDEFMQQHSDDFKWDNLAIYPDTCGLIDTLDFVTVFYPGYGSSDRIADNDDLACAVDNQLDNSEAPYIRRRYKNNQTVLEFLYMMDYIEIVIDAIECYLEMTPKERKDVLANTGTSCCDFADLPLIQITRWANTYNKWGRIQLQQMYDILQSFGITSY